MKRIRALWALFKDGYLREQGWFRSFVEGRAIDAHGEPVPWMNYAVIDFFERAFASGDEPFGVRFGRQYTVLCEAVRAGGVAGGRQELV